jgi:hypothetical protein
VSSGSSFGGPPPAAAATTTSGAPDSEPSPEECKDGVCPNCGHKHPGVKFGDELPGDTPLRRGIRADKVKGGEITKSAFQDQEMSCDLASQRTPAETMANSANLVGTVEFTAKESTDAFPDNKVVFRCLKENPSHCQVEGRKPDGKAKAFAKTMSTRLK